MTEASKPLKLTEKRLRILETAAKHPLGLVERPYHVGFERVAWDKNARALVEAGLLAVYRHGGYELTEAGRAQLPASDD